VLWNVRATPSSRSQCTGTMVSPNSKSVWPKVKSNMTNVMSNATETGNAKNSACSKKAKVVQNHYLCFIKV